MDLGHLEQYQKGFYEYLFGKYRESSYEDVEMTVHFNRWYDEKTGTVFVIKGRYFYNAVQVAYCHPKTGIEIQIEDSLNVFNALSEIERRFACGLHPHFRSSQKTIIPQLFPSKDYRAWPNRYAPSLRRFFHVCLQKHEGRFLFICFIEDMSNDQPECKNYGQGHTIYQAIQMSLSLINQK